MNRAIVAVGWRAIVYGVLAFILWAWSDDRIHIDEVDAE